MPPDRIAVIRRGVDHDVFSPGSRDDARQRLGLPHPDHMLLWVGRLSRVKCPDLPLEALERLASRGLRPWRCVIAGDGPLRAGLMRRTRRGALRDRVSFIERLDAPALADWYRAADALIVSSRSEGVPNVLFEAKACGTPVVATNAGDVADFLDEGGCLVPAGDPVRLAAAIAEVLTNSGRTRPARPANVAGLCCGACRGHHARQLATTLSKLGKSIPRTEKSPC